MSQFKSQQKGSSGERKSFQSYSLKDETPQDQGRNASAMQIEPKAPFEVRGYEATDFGKATKQGYAQTRQKYGPLAVTDPEYHNKTHKDARFRLNSLQREPLAVDQEERRVIDSIVSERVRETEIQIRDRAHQEGYEQGLALGREEAMQAARIEGEEILLQLREFVTRIEATKDDLLKASEKLIVELILRFAKSIVLRELSIDRDYVTRLAKQLISSTDLREHLRLKISSKDIENMTQIQSDLMHSFSDLKNLRIEESPLIQQGGVILESQWSTTDAAVETQIQRLFDAVLGGAATSQGDSNAGGAP
jgi:flagellar assembly protein FliH